MPFSVSLISCSRSAELVQASSFAWKSSSATPAQLRASAREPVKVPVLEVSFAASVNPSIGRLSPKVAYTPWQMFVHSLRASCSVVSFARWLAASVAVSPSPSTRYKSLYVSLATVAELPAASNADTSFACASRYSSVATVAPTRAVAAPATAPAATLRPVLAASPILLNPVLNFSRDTPLLLTNPSTSLLALLIALLSLSISAVIMTLSSSFILIAHPLESLVEGLRKLSKSQS